MIEGIDQEGRMALADALGDTPETTIAVHRLRNGFCRAYVAGDPAHFRGAIVQEDFCADEPMGFGSDPEVLWDLLKSVEGWDCVNVSAECAEALGQIIQRETGRKVKYYGDVYHVLSKPVADFQNEAVRLLTLDDQDLLENDDFDSSPVSLDEGLVAGAIAAGRLVAIARASARTNRYADMGVHTKEGWRCRGFVTAAASIVAKRVQEAGQTPIWSAGEDNFASLRVAEKLGFNEVSRRTYVIKD